MPKCEIRWCMKPCNNLIPVNDNIGDGSFRTLICPSCAKILGLKRGDDLPSPEVVRKKLKEARDGE